MDKRKILENIPNLTAEQLFDEIQKNNVSLSEISNTGELDPAKRNVISKLTKQIEINDDEAWERARYSNEVGLSDYITNFPAGKYVQEAKEKIRFFEESRRQAKKEKNGILSNLRNNPNYYSPHEIKGFLDKGTIRREELTDSGIPPKIIDTIYNIKPPRLKLGDTPPLIPEGYTEVYFWGIPGSGKTCALAALLSTAHRSGYLNMANGPGFDYMTRLKNIFLDGSAILPPPSPVETTQYLPFTLKKPKEKYHRSISLIELSGEIFQCFFHKNAGKELPSQSHIETFESLTNFLKGNNRKIHFFFIDYDKENRIDADGYTQSDYLESASIFFSKPENRFFDRHTDAVYVVLTKSDLMPVPKEERVAKAKEFVLSENFLSFINTVKDKCKKYDINAGRLTVEPFSLGKVYFQQICDFDNSAALRIIDILFERIRPAKKSILDVFNK